MLTAMCVLAGVVALPAGFVAANGVQTYVWWGLFPGCAIIAFFCWRSWSRRQGWQRLMISANGQIRLQGVTPGMPAVFAEEDARTWRLLPVSTLWSHLMILHLQDAAGSKEVIVILRDCVPAETFHALLVACRWLAMRASAAEAPQVRQN
ncbi:hypothetical protein GCM10007205_29020 [Oxalicibacterium flavum]|uniref:Flagellar hook-length control protein n=2 Tax=Oxalicibacterium flavum TaxID=179467 RepID=A0A8J2UQ24_9BURK|nr:hypothetical protein GCM10007205_29020 [Oxalicibacterium flavum]